MNRNLKAITQLTKQLAKKAAAGSLANNDLETLQEVSWETENNLFNTLMAYQDPTKQQHVVLIQMQRLIELNNLLFHAGIAQMDIQDYTDPLNELTLHLYQAFPHVLLDGGIDIQQEDLKSVLWVNKKEKPGNGVDDDGNGYIDDVHGWNFVGTPDSNLQYDNMELTRQVRLGRQRFGRYTLDKVPADYRNAFTNFLALQTTLDNKRQETKDRLENLQKLKTTIDAVVKQLGKEAPTLQDFLDFSPTNDQENQVRSLANQKMKRKTFAEFYQEDIVDILERMQNDLDYHYSLNYDPAATHTGNADVTGPDALHGTHVAGIIAADRNNSLGIRGIADHVRIMAVRCTPNGDERDEDVARAIRYAVDNGAKVINMSFGKGYTANKALVDEAVHYAEAHDVLLVCAAGNDDQDLDKQPHYPNPHYLEGGTAKDWITVGASDQADDETLKAPFSNYGVKQVDVFAPGVRIRSAAPKNTYVRLDGTSMAAPVVSGLAALIRSYYPKLTATQVREIIIRSVTKSTRLADRCITGGVVNAYKAVKLAEQYKTLK